MMRRFRKLRLHRLGISILISLVLAEIILRIATRSIPTYADVLANSLDHPERLYPPYGQLSYDVRDLYPAGGQVTLRVSANRFIEPEPQGNYHYHVLFLGDSTTEVAYVPENQRWVALLNQPGTIATYNAGQGGANTLDKYYTFRYLTDQGFKFDLVVLATSINDYGTIYNLGLHGYKYRLNTYLAGRATTYTAQYRLDVWTVIRDNVRLIFLIDRIVTYYRGEVSARDTFIHDDQQVLQGRQLVGLDRCDNYPASVHEYSAAAHENIKALADVIKATGAKLLLMDEATSFAAPASSFPVDFRRGPPCSSTTVLNDGGSHELFKELDQAYLQAAREAGVMTFDLAAAMDSLTNGPDASTYMYDAYHYVPVGSMKVAEILRPVIDSALAETF